MITKYHFYWAFIALVFVNTTFLFSQEIQTVSSFFSYGSLRGHFEDGEVLNLNLNNSTITSKLIVTDNNLIRVKYDKQMRVLMKKIWKKKEILRSFFSFYFFFFFLCKLKLFYSSVKQPPP